MNKLRLICILAASSLLVDCSQGNEPDYYEGYSFEEAKLCIIGDSISTFKGSLVSDSEGYNGEAYWYYYPHGDVQKVDDTWWAKAANILGIRKENINNCSWSSSKVTGDALSTTSAFAGCSERRISDVGYNGNVPDIIICYISCNDWSANCPVGDWNPSMQLNKTNNVTTLREAYSIMLKGIKDSYPKAEVFCMTNLVDVNRDKTPGKPSNNSNGVTVEEWNSNIMEIAGYYGCTVIETNDCGIDYDNIMQFVVDGGLHPNCNGMELLAVKVCANIKEKMATHETI